MEEADNGRVMSSRALDRRRGQCWSHTPAVLAWQRGTGCSASGTAGADTLVSGLHTQGHSTCSLADLPQTPMEYTSSFSLRFSALSPNASGGMKASCTGAGQVRGTTEAGGA